MTLVRFSTKDSIFCANDRYYRTSRGGTYLLEEGQTGLDRCQLEQILRERGHAIVQLFYVNAFVLGARGACIRVLSALARGRSLANFD